METIPSIHELLLIMDIDDLSNVCRTRKGMSICKDLYFWQLKFNYDNLTIINNQTTLSGWVMEYKAVLYATITTSKLLHDIDTKFNKLKYSEDTIDMTKISVKHFKSYNDIPFIPPMYRPYLPKTTPKYIHIYVYMQETQEDHYEKAASITIGLNTYPLNMIDLEFFYYNYFYYMFIHYPKKLQKPKSYFILNY